MWKRTWILSWSIQQWQYDNEGKIISVTRHTSTMNSWMHASEIYADRCISTRPQNSVCLHCGNPATYSAGPLNPTSVYWSTYLSSPPMRLDSCIKSITQVPWLALFLSLLTSPYSNSSDWHSFLEFLPSEYIRWSVVDIYIFGPQLFFFAILNMHLHQS